MGNLINFIGIVEKAVSIVKEVAITGKVDATAGSFNAFLALVIILMGILLVFGIGIFGTLFWIWMIVDCAQRKFRKSDDKLMWMIIVILLHFIGAAIYYFIVKKQRALHAKNVNS